MLPGDLLQELMRRGNADAPVTIPGQSDGGRPGAGLNPQSVAEFLAYDLPFRTPPALGFLFPSEVPAE